MTDKFDSIFMSDTHLSTLRCDIGYLNTFLDTHHANNLYIVGDLIDLWKLKTFDYWPPSHTTIIEKLIKKINEDTAIHYIIGNHDDFFSNFKNKFSDHLCITRKEYIEIGGKKFIVIHGDQFDLSIKYLGWIAVWLTGGYDLSSHLREKWQRFKNKIGFRPFSLSREIKKKKTNKVMEKYKKAATRYARRKGMDGIINGHTHIPELTTINGIIYANTGDFVKSSSFITYKDNKLELKRYKENKLITLKTIGL